MTSTKRNPATGLPTLQDVILRLRDGHNTKVDRLRGWFKRLLRKVGL